MLTNCQYLIILKPISLRKGRINSSFFLIADIQLEVGA